MFGTQSFDLCGHPHPPPPPMASFLLLVLLVVVIVVVVIVVVVGREGGVTHDRSHGPCPDSLNCLGMAAKKLMLRGFMKKSNLKKKKTYEKEEEGQQYDCFGFLKKIRKRRRTRSTKDCIYRSRFEQGHAPPRH
jgi:hypothetical protein